ncbi:MAG: signal peptidase I [Thermoleophilaceae bacterium]
MSVASREKSSDSSSLVELVAIVAVAVALAFVIQAFLIKPFRIPSESMVPTLAVGQRVLVDRVSGHFSSPDRGDVIVFKPPAGADEQPPRCGAEDRAQDSVCSRPTRQRSEANFIKRVVGEPGDRLKVLDGDVYINGRRQDEPFAEDCECPEYGREVTVPPGHFFMMGDNRGQSADSREWGPVPEDWIIGNAFFTYWPPRRVGPL